ncbi:response regulator transcription factor [Paenibacillus sp. JX-17]|uniref:Response regulator transcription factor n=1 Tax=Paenibacillus lacisoli TaxID=3064525 RepID=A0ABT9CEN3_9BACL|nr:response regulator transcription factor [Paenibacillus sp. JX-17]MDO7907725.1 response regulator transcription factor [Paenibacillus sp. JX-17]
MDGLCRVLIVDDEILVRQGMKHHLNWEQEGFRIVGEASNGQEALEMVKTLRPHIVITDIVMPVMDGEEFTRLVKQEFSDIEVIVLSSFGEFDYVRSTFQHGVVDYILKPKLEAEQLLDVLKKTVQRIPSLDYTESGAEETIGPRLEDTLEKLISGFEVTLSPEWLAEHFPYSGYLLAAVDLRRSAVNEEEALSLFHDHWELEGLDAEWSAGLQRLPGQPGMPVTLIHFDRQHLAAAKNRLKKTADRLSQSVSSSCILVSQDFKALDQLGLIYRDQLAKLAGQRFYTPDSSMLDGESTPLNGSIRFDMNTFMEEIRRRHFHSAFLSLTDSVKQMITEERPDVFEFKTFLSNIIFNVSVLLGSMNYDTKMLDENKYKYFRAVDDTQEAGAALALLEDFIADVNIVTGGREGTVDPALTKLLDYIEEHYADPLSLTEVARHFHFNPSYLSTYFADRNKEGFNEYVNKVRIEKAVALLQSGSMPISEISGNVGYSDHSYFCKVFKKFKGLSPSQYRKQHYS